MQEGTAAVKAASSDSVLIPVLNNKNIKSWPKHADGGEAKYVPIAAALTSSYNTDAHFAAYSSTGKARRLCTKAIEHGGVEMRAVVFDVDGADHKASDEWWEQERAKVYDLLGEHPDGFAYRTRGGYRVVYLAPLPIYIRDDSDRYAWWALYRAWVNYLGRRFAISADPGCKDWTRLFRLPRVVRDGVREEREIIGDATSIGEWHCELTAADMAELDGVAKKKVAPAGEYSGNYHGRGRLLDAFDRRGWLGHEIESGKVACRCPWEQSHSMGSTYDTSTVIYEADSTRGELGWFHCSHGHCADRSIGEVIAVFSDEEMGNPAKCGATTASGKTCAATELMSDGRCEWHTRTKTTSTSDFDNGPTTDTTAQAPVANTFELIRICDIPEIVKQEWLIEGLVPRFADDGTAGYIFAPAKFRKSMMLADMALSVATDTPAFGKFAVKHTGSVVGFFAEDPKGETSRRVHRLARGRGVKVPPNLHLINTPAIAIDNAEHQERLLNTLRAIPDLAMVFLDPMVRLHRVNDNRSEELGPIHTWLRTLARSCPGAVFVLAHHTNKDGGSRGSTDYDAFGDFNVYGRKKDAVTAEVHLIENRGGPPCKPFSFTIEDGFVEDEGPTLKIVVRETEDVDNERTTALEESIIAFRASNPGASGNACQKHLKALGIRFGNNDFWEMWKSCNAS